MSKQGRLVCVGVGMTLGAHISPICRSHIEEADIVFCSVSDPLVERWVEQLARNFENLQLFYQEGKDRRETYQQMINTVLSAVREGQHVVAVFYGHPGVFAMAPHKMIQQASEEGFNAHMEPGISAEDCLYADMLIDPGKFGCQHYEATQFMLYQRNVDTSAYLILWQIGLAGDVGAKQYVSGLKQRRLLLELLLQTYPPDVNVALYEAPTLAVHHPRIEWFRLDELLDVTIYQHSTLVIPPARQMQRNEYLAQRLKELDSDE